MPRYSPHFSLGELAVSGWDRRLKSQEGFLDIFVGSFGSRGMIRPKSGCSNLNLPGEIRIPKVF